MLFIGVIHPFLRPPNLLEVVWISPRVHDLQLRADTQLTEEACHYQLYGWTLNYKINIQHLSLSRNKERINRNRKLQTSEVLLDR